MGLFCALLVEARAWTDVRWDFGERGFVRAWALSLLLGTLTLAWFWLKGSSLILLFDFLVWMPVYLLPVALAQNYATQPSMPLNTFSFIARRKMLIDRAAGRPVEPIRIHAGYPYLCLVLVASALSRINETVFFVGVLSLTGIALVFASPVGRKRPVSLVVGLILVGILGAGTSIGLVTLYTTMGGVFGAPPGGHTSGSRAQTAIGQVGKLKLRKRIYWRIHEAEPAGRALFREAVYNHYELGQWWHRPVEDTDLKDSAKETPELLKREDDYEDMWDRTLPNGEREFAFEIEEFARDPGTRRKLRVTGQVRTKTPLPLPETSQRLSRIRAGEGGVDYNSLGTVRLENPDQSVVSFDVYYGGPAHYEKNPDVKLDLQVPPDEALKPGQKKRIIEQGGYAGPGIVSLCDQWQLRGMSAEKATRLIKERFIQEFDYMIYLSPGHQSGRLHKSAVARFLHETKAGHCEYFATAAALLLREAGIPARYCVGFSGQEKGSSGEWLLRGTHAHAWCRVWDGDPPRVVVDEKTGVQRTVWPNGKWIDFDPTPPGWLAQEGSGIPWEQRLLDRWQRAREDFLIWRTQPGNSTIVNWVMGIVGTVLLLYVVLRLARSRTRSRRGQRGGAWGIGANDAVITPLHELAESAEHWLGSRLEGEAFTHWILGLRKEIPAAESALRRAVSYHWKARFDPIGLDPSEEGEFEELCRNLRLRLKELRRARK